MIRQSRNIPTKCNHKYRNISKT